MRQRWDVDKKGFGRRQRRDAVMQRMRGWAACSFQSSMMRRRLTLAHGDGLHGVIPSTATHRLGSSNPPCSTGAVSQLHDKDYFYR